MRESVPGELAQGEPGLRYFVRLAARRFRLLAALSLAAGVLALGVALALPKWYEARAVVLPPHETVPPLAGLQDLSEALQLKSVLPFSAGVTLYDVYLAILDSDTLARSLVERYDLRGRYKQKLMVRATANLRSHTKVSPGKHRIIEIRVEDKDPHLAADLANAYVEGLDRLFRETRSTAGSRQREFLEARLLRVRVDLDSAETALARMEAGGGLPVLSRDLTAAALAAGDLIGRRLALSVRLEMLDALGVKDAPARREVEIELRAVEAEAARLPWLGLDVARRLRDLRVQETLFEAVSQQLEAARVEEVRDTPAVEVLDRAVAPDRHHRPRKGIAALAGAFVGLFLGIAWVTYSDPDDGG